MISDTHGLLRDAALTMLEGCELIIHAGDVGSPAVLEGLQRIAPVIAVRGNNDHHDWARALPVTEIIELGAHYIYLLHDLNELDVDPVAAGFAAVISGHSHRPCAQMRDSVLYLNPGSAGPRRFKLPVSLARLTVTPDALTHELIELEL
ncbi:MAG: metallophosphoesterase family protein [Pseudomonadota bacterium]